MNAQIGKFKHFQILNKFLGHFAGFSEVIKNIPSMGKGWKRTWGYEVKGKKSESESPPLTINKGNSGVRYVL